MLKGIPKILSPELCVSSTPREIRYFISFSAKLSEISQGREGVVCSSEFFDMMKMVQRTRRKQQDATTEKRGESFFILKRPFE